MNTNPDCTPNALTDGYRSVFLHIDYALMIDDVLVWLKTWTIGRTRHEAVSDFGRRHPDAINVEWRENPPVTPSVEKAQREAIRREEAIAARRSGTAWGYRKRRVA